MHNYKIALVETSAESVHVYSRTYLPRVGIPTLAEILNKLGYSCDIWFQSMPGFRKDKLLSYDIIGIGSITNTITIAYQLADYLKQSGKIVVMGGPHVSFMAKEALEHCDYVIIGEGEIAFPALIDSLLHDKPLNAINSLVYRLPDGSLYMLEKEKDAIDFESQPSPNFLLSPQVKKGKIPPIITTSRGCPHNCSFCSVTPIFGRSYRFKPNSQVINELRSVLDRSVCFGDDNFCANPKRTKSLLKDMIKENAVPLRWSGQMTVKAALDEELLDLLQQTRCRIMYVGIESINPETLQEFGKVHEVDTIARCIKNMHKYNIGIHGMFVLGANDTPKTAKQIVDYAITNDIDTIQVFSLTPFPGTIAYQEYESRLLHREWKYFDGMHVVMEPLNCTAFEIQMSLVEQMQRFYSLKRLLGSYCAGRSWRLKYRAGGNYLMRRWISENSEYIERLKNKS